VESLERRGYSRERAFLRLDGDLGGIHESARWPAETHVVLAAFDDPVDRAPDGHAFAREHVDWLPFELDEPLE
jgi:hypothetical protein